MRYVARLKGITPLIMHHNNIASRDVRHEGGKAGDDRSTPDVWKLRTYVGKVGNTRDLVMPTENLSASLLTAGPKCPIGGRKTMKFVSACVAWDEVYLPLFIGPTYKNVPAAAIEDIKGKYEAQCEQATALGFELWPKCVRIGKVSHIRIRPRFEMWAVEGAFEVDNDEIDLTMLTRLFAKAGSSAGLGDWRPSSPKPGPFGKFVAQVVEESDAKLDDFTEFLKE